MFPFIFLWNIQVVEGMLNNRCGLQWNNLIESLAPSVPYSLSLDSKCQQNAPTRVNDFVKNPIH